MHQLKKNLLTHGHKHGYRYTHAHNLMHTQHTTMMYPKITDVYTQMITHTCLQDEIGQTVNYRR